MTFAINTSAYLYQPLTGVATLMKGFFQKTKDFSGGAIFYSLYHDDHGVHEMITSHLLSLSQDYEDDDMNEDDDEFLLGGDGWDEEEDYEEEDEMDY